MQAFDLPQPEPRIYEIPDDSLESKPKTALVLEDNAAFADTLKDALESFGYRVTIVPTGAEGVQQILASDFDAIVCDMVMPNFPGDMFYLAVQRARPHLCQRFIFITGHQDNPKIVQFIKQSGCVALWKPFEMRRLSDALEFVNCGRRQPVPVGTVNPIPNIAKQILRVVGRCDDNS
jgi:CheY-like chemotaxis protein